MDLLIGYDVGSSAVKASVINAETGELVGSATSPDQELEIMAAQPGWAEQHPDTWWEHIVKATAMIQAKTPFDAEAVRGIGISYQMHGLVAVDKAGKPLRPAIIWCDSRAVEIGERAAAAIGAETCLKQSFNLPGNFTASKLAWVKENEPDLYASIHKIMLPGDYIALKLTGEMTTTVSGLSEGILWDFSQETVAGFLLDHYGVSPDCLAKTVPTFGDQGALTAEAAEALGLKAGTPVTYRGGDQPNNALSLNVLQPGEVAVTAGTSGVVYGVSDQRQYDERSRVNIFAHVNHGADGDRYGVLLCLNGTGILNSWLRRNVVNEGTTYAEMDKMAAGVPIGADGLRVYPYGNGAERTLENKDVGASFTGINFNTHDRAHLMRASQEGIVYALNYGLEIMRGIGMSVSTVRAGHANMFLSPLFASAFAAVTGAVVELFDTDGAQGAARGAGIGAGLFDASGAFVGLTPIRSVTPDTDEVGAYADVYEDWKDGLTLS